MKFRQLILCFILLHSTFPTLYAMQQNSKSNEASDAAILAAFAAYDQCDPAQTNIVMPHKEVTHHKAPVKQHEAQPQQPSSSAAAAAAADHTHEGAAITSTMLNAQKMREALERSHAILNRISQEFCKINTDLIEILEPHNTGTKDEGIIQKIIVLVSDLSASDNSFQETHNKQLHEIEQKMRPFTDILFNSESQAEKPCNRLASAIKAIPCFNCEIKKLECSIEENINILEKLRNRGSRHSLEPGQELPSNDLNLTREMIKFFTLTQLELRKIQEGIDRTRQEFDELKETIYHNWRAINSIIDDLQRATRHQESDSCWRIPLNCIENIFVSTSMVDPTTKKLSRELTTLQKNLVCSVAKLNAITTKFKRAEQRHHEIQADLKMLCSILDVGADNEKSKNFNSAYFDAIEKRFVRSIIMGEIRTQLVRFIVPCLSDKKILNKSNMLGKIITTIIKGTTYIPSPERAIQRRAPVDILPHYVPSQMFAEVDDFAQKLSQPLQDLLKKIYAPQEALFPEMRSLLDELLPQLGDRIQQDAQAERGVIDDLLEHPDSFNDWFTNKVLQTEDRGCILYDILCQTRLRLGRTAPAVRQLLKSNSTLERAFNKYVKKLADPNYALVEWGDFFLRISKWLPLFIPVQGIRLAEWFVAKSNPELIMRAQQEAQAQAHPAPVQEQPTSWWKRTINGAVDTVKGSAQLVGDVVATSARIVAGPIIHQTRIAQFLNAAETRTSSAWNTSLDFLYKKLIDREQTDTWRIHPARPENRLGLKFLLMRVLYNIISKCGARKALTDLEKGLIDRDPTSDDLEKQIGRIKRYRLYWLVEPFTALMAQNGPLVRRWANQFSNINQIDPIDRYEEFQSASTGAPCQQRRIVSQAIQDADFRKFLEESHRDFNAVAHSD